MDEQNFDPAYHLNKEHEVYPVGLYWGKVPGFTCETCGVWSELSHRCFRKVFGRTFIKFKKELEEAECPTPKK